MPVTGVADADTVAKIEEIVSSPFQNGERHPDSVELKENLQKLGFVSFVNPPNDYFGSQTERAVRDFQEHHGLPVTGIADPVTKDKIEELANAPLSYGMNRADAVVLKENLDKLGFASFNGPNDYFGTKTEQGVKDFQEQYDMPVTGVADADTVAKIEEIVSSPFQNGERHPDSVELKENLQKLGFVSFVNPPNDYFGSQTERAVKDFQVYHSLQVNGIADELTRTKIKDVLSSPFQNGERHPDSIELKENLQRLGFVSFANAPNNYFGSQTEQAVKDFQVYHSLPVSGIADEPTRTKIEEVISSPLQYGKHHPDNVGLKLNLDKLGYASFDNPNDYFGSKTEQGVKDFQEDYGFPISGIADKKTMLAIAEAAASRDYTEYNLTLSEALAMQMAVNPQTDNNYAYVSKSHIDDNNRVTANVLNVRPSPNTNREAIGQLEYNTRVTILEDLGNWYRIEYTSNAWKTASQEDTLYYLDPNNFINDEKQIFQFLDLSRPSNASAEVLNNYLDGRGILDGQGQAFIDASIQNGVSDIYLLSHALLETGNGTSTLATGVEVNGRTVYNMYGIGANDNCPLECGSQRAYEEGWFTPYDAIVGGAEFIGNSYIKSGQNTLYSMRWNPRAMERDGYAHHQYATDIGWASKQISDMYDLYQDIGMRNLVLDIPLFQ
jgi:mannosyl-glycoprotein endo-beta-N-acetylglucosaminidase